LTSPVQAQIEQVGNVLAVEVKKEYDLPILFAVDGVLDEQDQIWWLEINSNPMFPPTGYPKMLRTLFGF
jgi:D-alanine-D-alanine ligase-like ATP-grasp enzyme